MKIMIVEDEKDLCNLIASQLTDDGAQVVEAYSAEAGLEHMKKSQFDLIVTDVRLPEMDGIQMLKKIKQSFDPAPSFFVMSGYTDYSRQEILDSGAERFFSKPAEIGELFEEINKKMQSFQSA